MSEHLLQQAVATYLDQVLPEDAAWTAIDAGQGRMTPVAGAKRKARGVKAGWPDVQIVWQGQFHGIELKSGSRVSDKQSSVFNAIEMAGGVVGVCKSVRDVWRVLEDWGIPLRHHSLTPAMRDEMLAATVAAKPGKTRQNPVERTTRRVSKRALRFAAKAQMP